LPRVMVCVKYAINVDELKVDRESGRVITTGASRKTSDFDRNAVEEAVKLKEQGWEAVAVTVGDEQSKMALREALAMGVDSAYLLTDERFKELDTLGTSYLLAKAAEKLKPDLILCGEASIDSFSGQVGPRLAEWLGIPHIAYARSLRVDGDSVVVERGLEDRVEVVRARMPVLVSVTREINQPRTPSLMAIMKASRKEIAVWGVEELGVEVGELERLRGVEVVGVQAPRVERKAITIEGETAREIAEQLVKALLKEGVLG